MDDAIISTRSLSRQFHLKSGVLNAVNSINLDIHKNETLALVGESGSGKTTLSRLLLLLDKPSSGELLFNGKSAASLSRKELKLFRRTVQPVFQNPFSSLDPRMRIKHIIAEPLQAGEKLPRKELDQRVNWALEATGLKTIDGEKYPHQFSGGQRQRVAIARAIVSKPQLIILDEPVSSQDISIQAQILNLLKDLQQELGMSYLFIAHDLATVRFMSDRVAVMYLGKIVESGFCEDVFQHPRHPYTKSLLASVLPVAPESEEKSVPALGEMPSPLSPPTGCSFHPRCSLAVERCQSMSPNLQAVSESHSVSCFYGESSEGNSGHDK
ncbi:MAG: ATP-binding cassette domain-containing protein [Spongiibacteraceae bacterium]|nr:ATP-binding cassette domain-containing protein [Spongiibacteraceae bacterium]